eukprot:1990108-Rhodomonas_salina.1
MGVNCAYYFVVFTKNSFHKKNSIVHQFLYLIHGHYGYGTHFQVISQFQDEQSDVLHLVTVGDDEAYNKTFQHLISAREVSKTEARNI